MNSYYIAGVSKGSVYLGNTTAPLLITIIDNKLNVTAKKLITIDDKNIPFRAVRIAVEAPYFYVVDGTVPCIYKGSIYDWKATLIKKGGEYFAAAVPLDSVSLAILTITFYGYFFNFHKNSLKYLCSYLTSYIFVVK